MTLIHALSDLHCEFGKFKHSPPECDVVILSGDTHPGVAGIMWAQDTFPDHPVIYIPGNHEWYGKRVFLRHIEKMREKAKGSNVHFLYNDTVEIDGVRFLGTTLWTDFNLYGNAPMHTVMAQMQMNDFKQILRRIGTPFTASDSALEHEVAKQFLSEEFAKPFDGKTVVVGHHAPSELSVGENFRGDNLTPAYASRLENFILDHNPVLWTHGHIHSSSDYMIGDTRVLCNPRGYVGEHLNPDFDPNLVIEI